MAKLDDVDFSLSFPLWFVPFTRFSSLLHSAIHKNEKVKCWQDQREYRTRSGVVTPSFVFPHLFLSQFFPSLDSTNGGEVDDPEPTRKEETIKDVKLTPPQNENCDPCSIDRTHWIHRYPGISVMLPRLFLDWMYFTAAVLELVKKLITLGPSKHEGRVRSKLVCSFPRRLTKPVSVRRLCASVLTVIPLFSAVIAAMISRRQKTDKVQPGEALLYLAIQRLSSWKLIVLPSILLMASSQRSYCIFVCLHILDFNCESLQERNSILWTYGHFQQARIQAPRQDGALQAELTSICESTGVQEENVPCEEKENHNKTRDTQHGWKRDNKRKMEKEKKRRENKIKIKGLSKEIIEEMRREETKKSIKTCPTQQKPKTLSVRQQTCGASFGLCRTAFPKKNQVSVSKSSLSQTGEIENEYVKGLAV